MDWKKNLQRVIPALVLTLNTAAAAPEKELEAFVAEEFPVCLQQPEDPRDHFFYPLEELFQKGRCFFKEIYQDWIYFQSKELAGIRHPERYPLDILEETNRNLQPLDYKLNEELVVFFVSAYDYPLKSNQKQILELRFIKRAISSLRGFKQNYKLLVFESKDVLDILERRRMIEELYPLQSIAALGFIGHGLEGMIQLDDEMKPNDDSCLNQKNINEVLGAYLPLLNYDAPVFLISCSNGNGKEKRYNLANASARSARGHDVYSCTMPLYSVKFRFDQNGKLTKKPVELSGILPKNSCVYRANSEDYVLRLVMPKLFEKD